MSKRITLISFMNQSEINKINSLMSVVKEKTCKVPFGINDKKRYEIDNLPYHFTIFATDKQNQNNLIKIVEKINIDKIQVKINDVKIMKAKNDSHCLYLSIENNEQIKNLQRIFYNEFPKEHYNPENFTFHITLHIDNNYKKILELQKELKKNFKPFYMYFDTLALFDYPGDMIEKFNLKRNYKDSFKVKKYVGNKNIDINYRKRPGAYAIITRKEDNKIGIVTDGYDYFYLGGGIEENETKMDALNRELIEESGYTIKNIRKFDEVGSYIYADEKGYLEVLAYVYLAEFDTKITDPIEKDHKVLWVNPNDYTGKMCREWQEYILKEYISKYYK